MENNILCLNCHSNKPYYPTDKPSLCMKCWDLSNYCQKCNLHIILKKTYPQDEFCVNCMNNSKQCYSCRKNPSQFPLWYPVQCFECVASQISKKFWNMCSNCGVKD